jgi:amino acid permease
MLWYAISSEITDLGVAVSYLIIIGDLMPQVIGSIFPGSKSMPFLLDRQFWITAFMY